jgi:hypothetical protein
MNMNFLLVFVRHDAGLGGVVTVGPLVNLVRMRGFIYLFVFVIYCLGHGG